MSRAGWDVPIVGALAGWLVLALAFALYHSGGSLLGWRLPADVICLDRPDRGALCAAFEEKLIAAGVASGLSLLLHEQAHRAAARNYGVLLRVKPRAGWLAASLVLALGGLFVVGPTLVWPARALDRRQAGRIALAGPAASLIASAVCFAMLSVIILGRLVVPAWFPYLGYVGFRLNAMLALCSLAPLGRFDGVAVLAWSRGVCIAMTAAALMLTFMLGDERVLAWLLRVVTSIEG